MAKCSVEICDRESKIRGWCQLHYQRWWDGDLRPNDPPGTFSFEHRKAISESRKNVYSPHMAENNEKKRILHEVRPLWRSDNLRRKRPRRVIT